MPTPDTPVLTSRDELELQQLRQLQFWQERAAESHPDERLKSAHENTTILPEGWELTRNITLHEWQQGCIDAWFDAGARGVIKVVTGAGKTILALAIAERLQRTQQPGLRVAIVVPTLVLLDQWQEELLHRSNLPATAIGLVGGGNDATFDDRIRILVCVLNSASKKLPALVEKSGVGSSLLLIVDECHRAGASEMRRIFGTKRAYALGLSATPEREGDKGGDETGDISYGDDSLPQEFEDTVLGQELGPVIFELNYADAIRLNVLPPFGIRHYGLSLKPDESAQYERISREIKDLRKELERPGRKGLALIKWCRSRAGMNNPAAGRLVGLTSERKRLLYRMEERGNAVLRILRNAFNENPETKAILFHESIDEVMRLFGLLRAEGFPVVAEHSEFPERMRATSLRLFRQDSARIVVSARSLIEGFNVPSADIGIIVAASSSVRQRVQTLGRLLRKSRAKDGTEKHAVLHVLYAAKTVDEMIYEKADWEHFVGAERNQYFLWSEVKHTEPVPVSKAPRSPSPSETAVDDTTLRAGETYPGDVDEGVALTRDTQGTITTEDGRFILPHAELFKILKLSRKSAGRFRVTPVRHFVIELDKTGDGWRGVYLGRLNTPISIVNGGMTSDSLQNLQPGDSYPLSLVAGKTFSVLQRDPRLIASKTRAGVRFVPPLDQMNDVSKRESLAKIQAFLKSAYAKGDRISKVTVTVDGHVVYVFENRATFVGEAPEREDGFAVEQ